MTKTNNFGVIGEMDPSLELEIVLETVFLSLLPTLLSVACSMVERGQEHEYLSVFCFYLGTGHFLFKSSKTITYLGYCHLLQTFMLSPSLSGNLWKTGERK